MKIAHLIAQFYPYLGGAEIHVHNVCSNLVRAGHEATVITMSPAGKEKPDVNYDIIHLPAKLGGIFRRWPSIGGKILRYKLRQLQNQYQFDLWQVTMGYPLAAYGVDFFNSAEIPCLLRCCGEDIQKFPQIGYGYRLDPKVDELVSRQYPKFDALIALTKSVKEEYQSLSIPDDKIAIIPNGVKNELFSKSDPSRQRQIRDDFGVENDERLIISVGRYHQKKGFDLIPEIAKQLKEKGLAFKWAIVGKGTNEVAKKHPECSELGIVTVERFAANSGPTFNLPSAELIDLYCSADLFMLPTLIETFGMVLVEAMAAGIPVVSTECPGVKDVVEHEVTGLKATVNDTEMMADYIYRVFTEDGLREKLIKNGLKEARETYDWQVIVQKYLEAYRRIAEPNK